MDGWGIPQAHRHDQPFIGAEGCSDRGLVDTVWVDSGLKERIGHIYDSPNHTFAAISQDIIYTWQGVVVRNRVGIKLSVIAYPTRYSFRIFLGNNE